VGGGGWVGMSRSGLTSLLTDFGWSTPFLSPRPLCVTQGGFAFKHKDNNLVVSAPEGVALADIDGDRVKVEADALNAKKAAAVGGPPAATGLHATPCPLCVLPLGATPV
jgi:hypothetical protein